MKFNDNLLSYSDEKRDSVEKYSRRSWQPKEIHYCTTLRLHARFRSFHSRKGLSHQIMLKQVSSCRSIANYNFTSALLIHLRFRTQASTKQHFLLAEWMGEVFYRTFRFAPIFFALSKLVYSRLVPKVPYSSLLCLLCVRTNAAEREMRYFVQSRSANKQKHNFCWSFVAAEKF